MKTTPDPALDGITHINIYSAGHTELGQELSHFRRRPIVHPMFGHFDSNEGLWYWTGRRDDRLRHLSGFQAKQLGRSLPKVVELPEEEFQHIINLGNQAKLDTYPQIKQTLLESVLPLTHYYAKAYNGVMTVKAPAGSEWILAFFEQVRFEHNPAADITNIKFLQQAKARREAEPSPQGSLF